MEFLDKLLAYYKLNKSEYNLLTREVNIGDIPSFNVIDNINNVKDRLLTAINNKEKILIYGDYDADGILATSILVNTFKKLNYEVDYYIPSRYLDGYGINKDKVEQAKNKGYNLIITVDNGVNAIEAIDTANKLGIELIITDHHDYSSIPNVKYFIHPRLSKLKVTTSGAILAFYLSYALLNEVDPYLIALAATSIVSDSMPMKEENRNILRLAIRYLNRYKFDKFNLLSEEYIYDENVLALKVIPKINAIGRIEQHKEVNILVKYFTTNNYTDLVNIKTYLNDINEKRKTVTNELTRQIKVDKSPSITLSLDILLGLTGLFANRLLTTYNKPTAIFTLDKDNKDILRGSLRSKEGCSMSKFISDNKDLFVECGGHELASGVVIKASSFASFKARFNEFAINNPFIPPKENILIGINEINFKNYSLIRSLSPFGESFKEPTFIIKDIDTSLIRRIGKNSNHLLIDVAKDIKILSFNYPFNKINGDKITLIGKFSTNNFKNNITLNFTCES